jgi:hypothetical protein
VFRLALCDLGAPQHAAQTRHDRPRMTVICPPFNHSSCSQHPPSSRVAHSPPLFIGKMPATLYLRPSPRAFFLLTDAHALIFRQPDAAETKASRSVVVAEFLPLDEVDMRGLIKASKGTYVEGVLGVTSVPTGKLRHLPISPDGQNDHPFPKSSCCSSRHRPYSLLSCPTHLYVPHASLASSSTPSLAASGTRQSSQPPR